ncbi:16S rRNA (guanine(527)-N(7))-methyltransferase RsmG [Mycoplasmopsis columboralis]|uniref:Ribosomal RNA small subunit methyltransferase G n=1 Tax=Mycoplasmopsis columboralis TaxID=171282 RepID=A0A449B725_9BACT|nr:16S rRNA (guanine(527)-N(7))-methyltransferase RsmG [Mycoplasmopsis columboralis]VEU76391.1 glucose-inhibited division protein B [Mycoplasmopsis columboralis]
MLNKDIVYQLCLKNNWDFNKLQLYVDLIEQKNKVMNLTGFSGDKLWEEGILESLLFMNKIIEKQDTQILDIGAGAGFPSLPYAIVNSHKQITIYEPLQKRVDFLNIVIEQLQLTNVIVVKIRAEEVLQKNQFDVVTARAVGTIKTMLMASFHLVKLNGKMSLIKGRKYQEELNDAQNILKLLSTNIVVKEFALPAIDKQNVIVEITKKRSTPSQFPFKWKDIVKDKKTN